MDRKLKQFIEECSIPLVEIKEDLNYWLVRTQSGEFYNDFFHGDYIAIGWNEFSNKEQFRNPTKEEKQALIKAIDNQYEETKQPGRIYNQIYRFFFELKRGDIVIIPTENSQYITFGTIDSDAIIENISETDVAEGACPYIKRRKVRWIKTVKRTSLDPYLYRMLHTQAAISNVNDYADYIDRTLHSFYVKGNSAHIVFEVKKQGKIPGLDIAEFITSVYDFIPLLNDLNAEVQLGDQAVEKRDIDMRINVQSPGIIEFFTEDGPWIMVMLGLLLTFAVGGTTRFLWTKEKTEGEVTSEGLLEKILKLRKESHAHKLEEFEMKHRHSLELLQAKLPPELKNLLDENESRED